jgi:hypothetical protein
MIRNIHGIEMQKSRRSSVYIYFPSFVHDLDYLAKYLCNSSNYDITHLRIVSGIERVDDNKFISLGDAA